MGGTHDSPGHKQARVACDWCVSDPETDVVPGCEPETAMCVQDVDGQCVLQFTSSHAVGCALHRHTSRVIHHLELYMFQRCPAQGALQARGERLRPWLKWLSLTVSKVFD